MIPYGKQQITEQDIAAVVSTLQSDYLTQGPAVAEFEQNFARYVGSRYAVAVSNGTAALHLAVMALGLEAGGRIITTPITFAASANCARYVGGELAFADINPDTLTLDLRRVRFLLESFPKGTYKGIVPVDFAGYPVDMEAFRALADEFGVFLLEDACHAPGGYFTDSKEQKQTCGNGLADAAIFSFHPVKHIACGEGGMITTNRSDVYEKLLLLRTHGITKNPAQMQRNEGGWYQEMITLGYNYRMPDILAALGNAQLQRADENLARRQIIAQRYIAAFKDLPIEYTHVPEDIQHAYHLFVIQTDQRKALYDYLHQQQIYVQVHYVPCHLHPYYRQQGWREGDYRHAEYYYSRCLSLPMYHALTDSEQDYVIEKVRVFFSGQTPKSS
ncbi:MAG: UDP-4-amino-4,6-dideoxy-N-acetyl-beta-L-altrosamine transaminase [Chitinophagales bacterium]|nr:UDP-4-amino-4,6-dideoxy-N-acetyl-beta-L-altrosamine transaminase [Chitinophagales bacterium]